MVGERPAADAGPAAVVDSIARARLARERAAALAVQMSEIADALQARAGPDRRHEDVPVEHDRRRHV